MESRTADNFAKETRRVLREWDIYDKVVAVVTDNASNVTASVRLCGCKHVPCYAHSLNLIVQATLTEIEQVHIKVKKIVAFFQTKPLSCNKIKGNAKTNGHRRNKIKAGCTYQMEQHLRYVF
ncbi:hypothetical protein NQ314_012676 [Rhamnusium bicolor]|uniref:DUF659 domain-containing protein n=1 Tax=Rhamnusium bicolor TaxID=1586634 RepID=A0AAV8X9U6_9CUCU|nr:hypothetical protein NQ314_012676 [Rhamnusium bicolor]